jgi:hypothetical protein
MRQRYLDRHEVLSDLSEMSIPGKPGAECSLIERTEEERGNQKEIGDREKEWVERGQRAEKERMIMSG